MAEQSSEIIHDIREQRQHLEEHLHELHQKAEHATDWRTYIGPTPGLVVALTIAATGLLTILIGSLRRRAHES